MSRCLKCYGELEPQEVDYHSDCAHEIFGAPTPPSSPEESFTLYSEDAALRDLTMRLASSAAVLALPHTLLRGDGGELIYAEKDLDKDTFQKIMDEEEQPWNGSCEELVDMVESLSTISKLDVLNLWEQLIFCWVTGCSATPRELSLYAPHRGLYALTPASEFVMLLDVEPTLKVNGKSKGLCRSDFEASMKRSGIKAKIINGIFSRYEALLELWGDVIERSFVDEALKSKISKQMKSRISSLR